MSHFRRPKTNPVQEVNGNLLQAIDRPTTARPAAAVDQMDFLRQKINSHQGAVGIDFAAALEGSAPQQESVLAIVTQFLLIRNGAALCFQEPQSAPVRNFNVPTKRPFANVAAPVTFGSAFLESTTPAPAPLPMDIMREQINEQITTPKTFLGRVSRREFGCLYC